ncbi:MAG: hypothetical protein ACRDPK_04390 [Carbonactinosporaceae bacterium]
MVRYTGHVYAREGHAPMKVELRVTHEGAGIMAIDGGRVRVLMVGGETYVRAPAEYWEGHPTVRSYARQYAARAHHKIAGLVQREALRLRVKQLASRWVQLPWSLLGPDLDDLLVPAALADTLAQRFASKGGPDVSGRETDLVGGVAAFKVSTGRLDAYLGVRQPHRVLRVAADPPSADRNPLLPDVLLDLEYPGDAAADALRDQLSATLPQLRSAVTVAVNRPQGQEPASAQLPRSEPLGQVSPAHHHGAAALGRSQSGLTSSSRTSAGVAAEGVGGLAITGLTFPCGPAGCTVRARVATMSPRATVTGGTVNVWVFGGGGVLASCAHALGGIPRGRSTPVGCHAMSPRWTAFYAAATAPRRVPRFTPYFVLMQVLANAVSQQRISDLRDQIRNRGCRPGVDLASDMRAPGDPGGGLAAVQRVLAATVATVPQRPVCARANPLTRSEKRPQWREARRKWKRITGRAAGKAGCQIHHRIPLEWAHLFNGVDPNSLANLVGLAPEHHDQVGREWSRWKAGLGGRAPTQMEVVRQALQIDRRYGHYMKPISRSVTCGPKLGRGGRPQVLSPTGPGVYDLLVQPSATWVGGEVRWTSRV